MSGFKKLAKGKCPAQCLVHGSLAGTSYCLWASLTWREVSFIVTPLPVIESVCAGRWVLIHGSMPYGNYQARGRSPAKQWEPGRQAVESEPTLLTGAPRPSPFPSWLPSTRDARQPETHTLPCSYGVQKHMRKSAGENFGNFTVR